MESIESIDSIESTERNELKRYDRYFNINLEPWPSRGDKSRKHVTVLTI